MFARCDLGHDPPSHPMLRDLRVNDVASKREFSCVEVPEQNGGAGFISRSFQRQDGDFLFEHGGIISFFHPPPSCYNAVIETAEKDTKMQKIKILKNGEVVEGSFQDLEARHTTVWLDVTAPTPEDWEAIARHAEAPVEELQELLSPNQRPIILDIGKFTGIVFHAPAGEDGRVQIEPMLFLVSKEQKDFITIHERQIPAMSEIADRGYEVVDWLSEEISKIEQEVFDPKTGSKVMKRIFSIKKALIYFQRALTLDREVVFGLEKAYGNFLDKRELTNFRLLYSDLTQLIELAATYRDVIISTVEVHLSSISNNLNVVMKRLTAWAAIVLVPSLIAGIYGMNFQHLPLAGSQYGFWVLLGLMAASVWALYGYFKHNDWI